MDVGLVSRIIEAAKEHPSTEPKAPAGWSPAALPGTRANSAPSGRPADDRSRCQLLGRPEGVVAAPQARPGPRHAARAPGSGRPAPPGPCRVLGAGALGRSPMPGQHLGRRGSRAAHLHPRLRGFRPAPSGWASVAPLCKERSEILEGQASLPVRVRLVEANFDDKPLVIFEFIER